MNEDTKTICRNCKYWIELIDNGQCKEDMKSYCEYDDTCFRFTKK